MYEDEDYYVRNQYLEDDFDGRNALLRRRRPRRVAPQMVPYPVGPRPVAPWEQAPPAPVIDRWTGNLKLGLVLDAAAQVLAAMATLPVPPVVTGDAKVDMANLVEFQRALAQHAKRDEQIRTAGALAKLFLV